MYENLILIPYRKREAHLAYFLEYSWPKLRPHASLVILEQDNEKLLNRGALLNIGFHLFGADTKYFITHDVDINPTDDTIRDYYIGDVDANTIKGIYTSACDTLGGIIKLTPAAAQRCNGFPNDFWGWGVEDKAFQNRAVFAGLRIEKNILNNDPERTKYFSILNDIDDRKKDNVFHKRTTFEYNIFPLMSPLEKRVHIYKSGLNNLIYNVKSNTILDCGAIHIKVDF